MPGPDRSGGQPGGTGKVIVVRALVQSMGEYTMLLNMQGMRCYLLHVQHAPCAVGYGTGISPFLSF